MSEEQRENGGESILTEVIELASEYLTEDLNDKIEDAVKKAIVDILNKYGRNVEGLTFNAKTGAPLFVDESGKCEDGENCQLDNGTPRGGKHLDTELFQQVLKAMNEDVAEGETISPTNPLTSSCHSYDEEDEKEGESKESKKERKRREKQEKKEAKQKKKAEKQEAKEKRKAEGKGRLDTLIEREDVVNERLNKAVYAFLLNSPGVAQVIMGKQLTQTAIVNNDMKPIPVVIVTELNNSESNQTKRKKEKAKEKEKEEVKEKEKEEVKEEVKEEEVVLEIVSEEQEDTEEGEEENGGTLQGKGSVAGSLIV